MKYQELVGKELQEVETNLKEKRARVSEIIFLRAQGKVKNIRELDALRQDIARIQTYIRQLKK